MTEYGLIGAKLGHSFSKEIHAQIGDYGFELIELTRSQLESFMREKNFKAVNVTIPYKQAVIPFMDAMSEAASAIGAVNCVRNDGGKLSAHNTDFDGLSALIKRIGIDMKGKKVLILGTGGTSDTALAVCRSLNAGEVIKVSRGRRTGAENSEAACGPSVRIGGTAVFKADPKQPAAEVVTYDEAYEKHGDVQVIINTTPSGMYPNIYDSPINLENFGSLEGVADVIYNPLRTRLVTEASERGIRAGGGLYMLVAQAVSASEFFLNRKYEEGLADEIYGRLLKEKTNIVLTGMPGSGKTTLGKAIAEKLGRRFFDVDEIIVDEAKMSISEMFERYGEVYFREKETETVRRLAAENGAVIATGGGTVVKKENERLLRMNGRIVFVDRKLDLLVPTSDRPTAFDREQLERRYKERYGVYRATADMTVDNNGTEKEFIKKLSEVF